MNILLLGALPPPVHGLSVANAKFAELAARQHAIRAVDATGASRDARSVGRFSLAKIFGFLGVYAGLRHLPWCDVVYMTPGQTFFGVAKMAPFVFAARLLGKPVVFHLHGGALGQVYASLKGLRKVFFALVVRGCSAAIVLSDYLRPNFKGLLSDSRVHVVPNFADRRCFALKPVFPEHFDAEHPLRVLYLSNLIPSKGVLDVLDAVGQLLEQGHPVALDLAGHAEPEIADQVDGLCHKYPQIHWYGVVTGAEKYALLEKSHLLALPTTYPMEGQPICILETMAAGLGVLTTRHAGIPDIFREDSAIFVPGHSPVAIAEILEELLAHPEQLTEMARANRRQAQRLYTEEVFVQGILKVLEGV